MTYFSPVWVVWVTPSPTNQCMSVTHAASTYADVFDAIIVLSTDGENVIITRGILT